MLTEWGLVEYRFIMKSLKIATMKAISVATQYFPIRASIAKRHFGKFSKSPIFSRILIINVGSNSGKTFLAQLLVENASDTSKINVLEPTKTLIFTGYSQKEYNRIGAVNSHMYLSDVKSVDEVVAGKLAHNEKLIVDVDASCFRDFLDTSKTIPMYDVILIPSIEHNSPYRFRKVCTTLQFLTPKVYADIIVVPIGPLDEITSVKKDLASFNQYERLLELLDWAEECSLEVDFEDIKKIDDYLLSHRIDMSLCQYVRKFGGSDFRHTEGNHKSVQAEATRLLFFCSSIKIFTRKLGL